MSCRKKTSSCYNGRSKYVAGLSRALKIEELKALMNKYPRYHTNPDSIVRLAVYNSINGDNTLLDDKLEQLRTIDSLAKYSRQKFFLSLLR
jgi:hypothetical protein